MTDLQLAMKQTLKLRRLRPSTKVNRTLSDLVHQVTKGNEADLAGANQSHIQKVRRRASRAESYMEAYWARRIVRSQNPREALKTFPYLTNYELLTKRELEYVHQSGLSSDQIKSALIIGSGPLPLTAYELARQASCQVDQVDASRAAARIGSNVSRALGLRTTYMTGLGQSIALKDTYDLILVAALAGETTAAKQAIIDNILPSLRPGGRIIVRSAHGARSILYPIVGNLQHIRLLQTHHPEDEIINSILIYEAV